MKWGRGDKCPDVLGVVPSHLAEVAERRRVENLGKCVEGNETFDSLLGREEVFEMVVPLGDIEKRRDLARVGRGHQYLFERGGDARGSGL